MAERHGNAIWPGVVGMCSCEFTTSHGTSPGTGTLIMNPQDDYPSAYGTLLITDGVGSGSMPGCRLSHMRVGQDNDGFFWHFIVEDRRWEWHNFGAVRGVFNLPDNHSKLVPWTIASPYELAVFCLKALGVTRYVVDLPPGLTRAQGELAFMLNPPWIGVIPVLGTNPPYNWDVVSPAQALQQVCDQYGRRVIYRQDGSVIIQVPGTGQPLPDGSVAKRSPSIKFPATPGGLAVVGKETRYQARFLMQAVGRDWDGSYRPIDYLSYTPRIAGRTQEDRVYGVGPVQAGQSYQVIINAPGTDMRGGGYIAFHDAVAGDTYAAIAANLVGQINATGNPLVSGVVRAQVMDGTGDLWIKLTGVVEGRSYQVWATLSTANDSAGVWYARNTRTAAPNRRGWQTSVPGQFLNVLATDRLTRQEALELARDTVFRCYQVYASSDGTWPIRVPGYGPVRGRQWLTLQPTQVEQAVPVPGDQNLVQPRPGLLGGNPVFTVDFYNGYNRDKKLAIYGSVCRAIAIGVVGRPDAIWADTPTTINTPDHLQLFLPFQLYPEEQMIKFDSYVYRLGEAVADPGRADSLWQPGTIASRGRSYTPAKIIIQTATLVRNPDTSHYESLVTIRPAPNPDATPGGSPVVLPTSSAIPRNYAVKKAEDVQLLVVGRYAINISPGRKRMDRIKGVYNAAVTEWRIFVNEPGADPTAGAVLSGVGNNQQEVSLALLRAVNGTQNRLVKDVLRARLGDPTAGEAGVWLVLTGDSDGIDWSVSVATLAAAADFAVTNKQLPVSAGGGLPPERLVRTELLDADALVRAGYYLDGMAAQYFPVVGETREYNGIVPIDLDGAVSQISWHVGDSGAYTEISRNTEHSVVVPPYPARRLREFLSPAELERTSYRGVSPATLLELFSGPRQGDRP